jgi:hypothetical protein
MSAEACDTCGRQYNHNENCPLNPDNPGPSKDLGKTSKQRHNEKMEKWAYGLETAQRRESWEMVERIVRDIREDKIS